MQTAPAIDSDKGSSDVLEAIKRIMVQSEEKGTEVSALLEQIKVLLPSGGVVEDLIRILVRDHPDAAWNNIRPTIQWALAVRGGADESLLAMILRGEVEVSNTEYLQLRLRSAESGSDG